MFPSLLLQDKQSRKCHSVPRISSKRTVRSRDYILTMIAASLVKPAPGKVLY